MHSLLLLTTLCSPAAPGERQEDPTKAKVERAKTTYAVELLKVEMSVGDAFNASEDAARKRGDKAALDRIKTQRLPFDLTGTLPKNLPAGASQKLTAASNALTATYAQAVKEYTKAGKDIQATALQKELEQHKKGQTVPRYFALVNAKTGLVVATEKEDGARGSHLVQVMKDDKKANQQWMFVPTDNPQVYHIKNRASGHFFNIGGGVKEGAQLTVWDGGGGTNNNFAPIKSGANYAFMSTDSKKFACVADLTNAEGKPIIQREKPDGEHLWSLEPIK